MSRSLSTLILISASLARECIFARKANIGLPSLPESLVQEIVLFVGLGSRQLLLEVLLKVHFTTQGDTDHLEFSLRVHELQSELYFKYSANLVEVIVVHIFLFAELYKVSLAQGFTSLKIALDLSGIPLVHKDVHHLQKLFFEDDGLVLGKDIKNVP